MQYGNMEINISNPFMIISITNTHAPIQFTVEEEQEGKIPFLDVMVERREKKWMTSVFWKKTHTGH